MPLSNKQITKALTRLWRCAICAGSSAHAPFVVCKPRKADFLESNRVGTGLKSKSALKSTGKSLKSLEKPLNSTIFYRTALLIYKIVMPLVGAAYAAPNKGTTILY